MRFSRLYAERYQSHTVSVQCELTRRHYWHRHCYSVYQCIAGQGHTVTTQPVLVAYEQRTLINLMVHEPPQTIIVDTDCQSGLTMVQSHSRGGQTGGLFLECVSRTGREVKKYKISAYRQLQEKKQATAFDLCSSCAQPFTVLLPSHPILITCCPLLLPWGISQLSVILVIVQS